MPTRSTPFPTHAKSIGCFCGELKCHDSSSPNAGERSSTVSDERRPQSRTPPRKICTYVQTSFTIRQLNPFDASSLCPKRRPRKANLTIYHSTRLEIHGFNRRSNGPVHLRISGHRNLVVPHALPQERY